MGTVYLGHDPYIDRAVAIKVAHAEQLNDEEGGDRYRKMFFNEAHTAGRLTHPNIIGIYDAGVDGDACYIVMELVEGGETLKKFCRQDNLQPIEKVVETIFKCAKALDYAHKQGVIHRDIKPTNILVTKEDDVKIGDFSIAHLTKLDSTDTMPMGLVGSPRYMSPEQVTEDYITSQMDLFRSASSCTNCLPASIRLQRRISRVWFSESSMKIRRKCSSFAPISRIP